MFIEKYFIVLIIIEMYNFGLIFCATMSMNIGNYSDVMSRAKLPPYQRKRSFINQFPTIMANNATISDLPKGTVVLENQVAGHTFQIGNKSIGMLRDQYDGSVLKAILKPAIGAREIKFYEELQSDKPKIPRELVAEFRGTVKMFINGDEIEFIKLSDITLGMTDPCILDIKIGKRTWDPLATQEKIIAEESKYCGTREKLGFCIPGFQVYDIKNGRLKKYGKDYGKNLNENTIKDAIKMFLNADSGLCRPLLMQFLSTLWSIQKWARTQTSVRLYASSVLLVYDARRLKNYKQSSVKANSLSNLNGNLSPATIRPKTPPTAEVTNNGNTTPPTFVISNTEPTQVYRKVQRSHSAQNNYDEDLKAIRENYAHMLDNLLGTFNDKNEWAVARMIDFAHAFPAEDNTLDINYKFGIENVVKLFEELLKECD